MVDNRPGPQTWFAATLLFRSSVHGEPSLRPLCELRVVLFRDTDEERVRRKAQEYGLKQEHAYPNGQGQRVRWRYVRIEQVEEILDQQTDGGWEVSSKFVRRSLASLVAVRRGRTRQS